MPDLPQTLLAYLWDLRAQLEAQLRCLTKVQRWVAEFSTQPKLGRSVRRAEIIQNLSEIESTADVVRTVTAEAIVTIEGQERTVKPDRRVKSERRRKPRH